MSAVMSTLSIISGGRRSHQKLSKKSGRKSGQYSDAGDDRDRHKDLKEQRSASLQTLETGVVGVAQLETLEAKMASIEVSLGGGGVGAADAGAGGRLDVRRRGAPARELDALRNALREKDALVQSLKEQLSSSLSVGRLAARVGGVGVGGAGAGGAPAALSQEERRALLDRHAAVARDLDAKRAAIAELKRKLEKTHVTDNIDSRIEQAELQYAVGREELELLTLGEQARALHALVVHADAASAQRHAHTLYSVVLESGGCGVVATAEASAEDFAAAPRRCGTGFCVEWARDSTSLKVGDRLLEVNGSSAWSMRCGDELRRALCSSAPAPARLLVLREPSPATQHATQHAAAHQDEVRGLRGEVESLRTAAVNSERARIALQQDNTRLTHRISYLEDHVAELLARDSNNTEIHLLSSSERSPDEKTKKNVTNISITAEPDITPKSPTKPEVQVFQKGPDITALVANLPGLEAGAKNTAQTSANLPIIRPKSNMSNVSNTHIGINSPRPSRSRSIASEQSDNELQAQRPHPPVHRSHRQSLDAYTLHLSKSSHSLDHKCKEKFDSPREEKSHRMRHSISQHCISHKDKLNYQSETAAALEIIRNNQRYYIESPLTKDYKDKSRSEDSFRDYDQEKRNLDSIANYYDRNNYYKREDSMSADALDESPRVRKTNWAEKKTLSIIEQLKQSQRLRKSKSKNKSVESVDFETEKNHVYHKIDGKIIENAHKSNRRLSKLYAKGTRSSELDSENSDFPLSDVYSDSPRMDYNSETGSSKMSYFRKHENGEIRVRPMPPKKPLRLSLHRAQSSQSVGTDLTDNFETCTNASSGSELKTSPKSKKALSDFMKPKPKEDKSKEETSRKPAKRNHKGDKFLTECKSDKGSTRSSCATPKPTKKLLNGFSSYDAPAADDLYPDPPKLLDSKNSASSSVSRSESNGSRTPSRADSNTSGIRWPPSTPLKNENHRRLNNFLPTGKWC